MPTPPIAVDSEVLLRHGRGSFRGTVIELIDDGTRARVKVCREGEADRVYTRAVNFLEPIDAGAATPVRRPSSRRA